MLGCWVGCGVAIVGCEVGNFEGAGVGGGDGTLTVGASVCPTWFVDEEEAEAEGLADNDNGVASSRRRCGP